MVRPRYLSSPGFTLVELLVVIAIIGLVLSLIFPAIQASREVGRGAQCTTNQRQLGLALLAFESNQKSFPSSMTLRIKGPLTGDPELAMHSFMVDLLPYLEEGALYSQYDRDALFCAPQNAAAIATPLSILICPSAPSRAATPVAQYMPSLRVSASALSLFGSVFENLDKKYSASFRGANSDYGVPVQAEDGVATLFGYKIGKNDPEGLPTMFPSPVAQKSARAKLQAVLTSPGVSLFAAQTKTSQITDGLSHTIMLTEIAGRPHHWQLGMRTSAGEPLPSAWADPYAVAFDIRGIQTDHGKCIIQCGNSGENGNIDAEIYSFHPGGVNFVFADGHVSCLGADIDPHLLLTLMTPNQGDN